MCNWRFGIVVVVLIGKPPLMGEVLCSTENSPFLIIDHIHAKMNRVCCAALAIGKKCMNVRKNKLLKIHVNIIDSMPLLDALSHQADREQIRRMPSFGAQIFVMNLSRIIRVVSQENLSAWGV